MAEGNESDDSGGIVWHAGVPRWLTVLTIVAASDAIGTVPLKLAERHAKLLNLQIIRPPFLQDLITVSAVRRAGATDAGADWFYEQVKAAVR
jgi:DNA-binding transcriptional LysR family regulator